MRNYSERTPQEDLESTVRLGLKSGPTCLVSDARLEQCLGGLSAAERAEWREGFCREEGLTAEAGPRGVLFSRAAQESGDGGADQRATEGESARSGERPRQENESERGCIMPFSVEDPASVPTEQELGELGTKAERAQVILLGLKAQRSSGSVPLTDDQLREARERFTRAVGLYNEAADRWNKRHR